MGMIRILVVGSFAPHLEQDFSAMERGHAAAVAEAIAFLANVVMPKAIAQDHALQGDGHYPSKGFGEKDDKPGFMPEWLKNAHEAIARERASHHPAGWKE